MKVSELTTVRLENNMLKQRILHQEQEQLLALAREEAQPATDEVSLNLETREFEVRK